MNNKKGYKMNTPKQLDLFNDLLSWDYSPIDLCNKKNMQFKIF